jgi:hypothetical protein
MGDKIASLQNARRIATTGEIFENGKMLEVVSCGGDYKRLNLAFWDGQSVRVGPRFRCMGGVYEPATTDHRILQALKFPKLAAPDEPPRKLLGDISATLQRYSSLGENSANLVAYFTLGSWVIDAIPTAPRLSMLGTETVGSRQLLRLLNCFCRHSLILTEVDAAGLSSLSMKWQPTLLIKQPRLSASLQRLLRATRQRYVHVPRRGRLLDVFCAVATFTDFGNSCVPQNLSGIEIPVDSSCSEPAILKESEEREIANHFQDRLLAYRFTNHNKVLSSTFDVQHFTFGMRELAQSFGRCTPGDAELQQNLIQLLAAQDAEIRSEKWTDVSTVIVEALLAACHEKGVKCVYVGEIAETVEVILTGRGENRTVSAKEVAERIRALGLVTEPRDSRGFKLRLNQVVRRRVHDFAYALAAPTIEAGVISCMDCRVPERGDHAQKG